jgi:hypothetical protein
MGTDYRHREWLLDMVSELGLQRRLAKIRAKTVRQEWEILDKIVSDELRVRKEDEEKRGRPVPEDEARK